MKVAVVIERYDVSLGGAEWLAFELVSALSQLGIDTRVLTAKASQAADNVQFLFPNVQSRRIPLRLFSEAVWQHLNREHFDIVHSLVPLTFADVYQPPGGSFVEAAIRNATSFEHKFMISYKKATAFMNRRRAESLRAERQLCADPGGPLLAALSEYVRQQFRTHYGLADKRIAVIPNGVRTDKPVDSPKAKLLKTRILSDLRIGDSTKAVFFLFGANNFRLKGLAVLLKALAIANAAGTAGTPYLIVAGNDKPHKYLRLAKKIGIANRILFLGFLSDIQNALAISDVAVLPTFYDPSSRFILEALAAGRPVITTKFNGACDLFVNNRHGKVIDTPENITALSQAILYFTDANNLRTTAENIRTDNLKEKISIDRLAGQLLSVYESTLQKRDRHRCMQFTSQESS
jgi:UDP-glucose:(heptosyl)LPS alpha-1,3-glucosyltransferase